MKQYTVSDINRIAMCLESKGYRFFGFGNYNLNVIAIRSEESISNRFDDALLIIYTHPTKGWVLEQFECTTDPGKDWLLNPLNIMGTLITIPGQYPKSHKIGLHNKSKGPEKAYVALEQVNPMKYVRDNNRDNKLDFSLMDDPKNIITGIFQTNIHRASKWGSIEFVGPYSAGCTVLRRDGDLSRLIELVKLQKLNNFGDHITYTLIEEKWLK